MSIGKDKETQYSLKIYEFVFICAKPDSIEKNNFSENPELAKSISVFEKENELE